MLAIPGDPTQLIISCNYDPTGLAAVDLFDNPVLGWLVEGAPEPVITGTMPPLAAGTGSVLSPHWAHLVAEAIYVPDLWRGSIQGFFTWMAVNNGAQRLVRGNFGDERLKYAMGLWSQQNASLFNAKPF